MSTARPNAQRPAPARTPRRRRSVRTAVGVGAAALLLAGAACGGDDEDQRRTGDSPTTASSSTSSTTSTSDVPGTTDGSEPDADAPGAGPASSTTVSSVPGAVPGKPNAPVGDQRNEQQAPGPTQP